VGVVWKMTTNEPPRAGEIPLTMEERSRFVEVQALIIDAIGIVTEEFLAPDDDNLDDPGVRLHGLLWAAGLRIDETIGTTRMQEV
jgi:hypothetical protein